MPSWRLAQQRRVAKEKIFDSMGRLELAANLFRVTMTEERIKREEVIGQTLLENTHFEVGREVRDLVQRQTGINPEQLPQEKALPTIKKELKTSYKHIKKQK